MEYFSINPNNIDSVKSIYVSDDNKNKLTKLVASNFTKVLEELDLSGCSNILGVLPVSKCTNLKKVNISGTKIKNITSLKKCLLLEELIIDSNRHNNIQYLQNIINLKKLVLNCDYININFNLPNLEIIEIYSNRHKLSISCSTNIFTHTTIKDFNIEFTIVLMNDFNKLINLNNLRIKTSRLYFDRVTNISLLSLEKLVLINNDEVNSNLLKIFFSCTNIKHLSLSYNDNSDRLNNVDDILCFTNLEELHLNNTNIVFTQEIFNKLNTLKNLKKVYICDVPNKKLNFKPININYDIFFSLLHIDI